MRFLKELLAVILFYVLVPAAVLYSALQFIGGGENSETFMAVRGAVSSVFSPQIKTLRTALKSLSGEENQEEDAAPVTAKDNLNRATPTNSPVDQSALAKAAEKEDPNNLPLEFLDQSLTADEVLSDRFNRLPETFKVSDAMKSRIHFWFDIYTKYSSRFAVIHDQDRPWIVYRVIDTRPIHAGPENSVVKELRSRKAVAKALAEVRQTLHSLSRKRGYSNLSSEEYKFFTLLQEFPGARNKVFAKASFNVRSQTGQKDFFRKGLITSNKYINEMEEIFARYDLPVELTRLPLVESSFNEAAISKVGASGIWQFMPSTGRTAKLKVTEKIDERNNPIKASVAAARLMLQNFKITKSWPLAITSYNHGPGGVLKASRAVGSSDIADIVNKYNVGSFGFASQNFYSEFMAALYAEKYQQEVFGHLFKHPPLQGETLEIRNSMRIQTLVDIVGITMEEFKLFNPDLKRQFVGPKTFLPVGYHVRMPQGRGTRLELFNQQAEEARRVVSTRKKVRS